MTTDHPQVRVLPSGITFPVAPDETVMSAAQRSGYRWPTVCGGKGTCRTCFVVVEEGNEHCSQITDFEAEGIAALGKTVRGDIRLACRLRISGGTATVHKRGVKPVKTAPNPS